MANRPYELTGRTAKRTYTIREATLRKFESAVPSGERSKMIEDLIERELAERRLHELRQSIIKGCRDMADVTDEVNKQWEPATTENWPTP